MNVQDTASLSHANRQELFAEVIRNTDLAINAALPSGSQPVAPPGALPVGLSLDVFDRTGSFLAEKTAAHIEMLLTTSEQDIRT